MMIDPVKAAHRVEINKQVEKFLRRGGRIQRDPHPKRRSDKWIRVRPFRMDLD